VGDATSMTAVNKVDRSLATPAITLLRVAARGKCRNVSQQQKASWEPPPQEPDAVGNLARPAGFEPVTPWLSGHSHQ